MKMGARVSDETAELFKALFGTVNAGGEYFLSAFRTLYYRTLNTLQGRFSKYELFLMIDVLNGSILSPDYAGQQLQLSVADGIELDKLNEEWNISANEITSKLALCSVFEVFCLEVWCQGFWEQHGNENSKTIEDYISQLAP